ncbi:MAG TPA: metallophosphoesterase, partial [Anaeromyxobacter sp.]|nr:metallophosphoesterase [Anaeromyxobacter sp.]
MSDLHVSDRSRYPRNGFAARDCERHSSRLAKGLLDALREVGVDHLVCTGDVTFSAEPREFERAAELLRPFAEARKLTVVPGNHDLWTEESVETARFLRALGPDGRGMRKA